VEFSDAYGRQNAADYEAFAVAVKEGVLEADVGV
jgi:hypothetical protein